MPKQNSGQIASDGCSAGNTPRLDIGAISATACEWRPTPLLLSLGPPGSPGRTPAFPLPLESDRDCLCVRSVSAAYARWHIGRDLGKIGESRRKSYEALNVVEV